MAKKMTVGVMAEELPGSQEKGFKTNETSDKLIHSCMGLLFSSQFPTADTLATLRQRKKVLFSVFLLFCRCCCLFRKKTVNLTGVATLKLHRAPRA